MKMKTINPQVRAMAISGYLDPETGKKMLENGMLCFIEKPCPPKEILARVRDVLDKNQAQAGLRDGLRGTPIESEI